MKKRIWFLAIGMTAALLLAGCSAEKKENSEPVAPPTPVPQESTQTAEQTQDTAQPTAPVASTPETAEPIPTPAETTPVPAATVPAAQAPMSTPPQAASTQPASAPDPIPKETDSKPAQTPPAAGDSTDTANSATDPDAISSATPLKEKGNYKDGTYNAQSEPDSDGYYIKGKMIVNNGNITAVSLKLYDKSDVLVDKTYAQNLVDGSQQMLDNIAGLERYALSVIEVQNVVDVQAISTAAWSYELFQKAMPMLIKLAQ